jgi:hypothetical protein
LFEQNVGALDEIDELAAVGLALEVAHHAFLAAVQQREGRAFAGHHRRERAHALAAWALDLDHLGARFRQHQGGQRPRQQGGEIEDQ